MTPGQEVRIDYRRPPDRSQTFRQLLVVERDDVVVTIAPDLDLPPLQPDDGPVALEPGADAVWFTFPGAWHDIGRFHLADGTFTGLYVNILTPVEAVRTPEWATTDLYLDLWLPASGGPPILLDEDEFDAAVRAGHLDPESAARAREEAGALLLAAERGAWPPAVVAEWTRARCREALGL